LEIKILKNIFEMFLHFDKDYLILPLESMPIYDLMQEIDKFINLIRNQKHLCLCDSEIPAKKFMGNKKNICF
jgi:hypothetical protein